MARSANWLALASVAMMVPSCTGSFDPCNYRILCVDGAPKLGLSGDGPNLATATYPSPCEIDIDFGNVPIGLSNGADVHVNNQGNSALDLSPPVDPVLDPELILDYGAQQPIQPGEYGQFTVTFEPYKLGLVTSTFTIQTDGLNWQCPADAGVNGGDLLTVSLMGTGVQLSLVVEPVALDFGNTLLYTSTKKSVTLINKSTAPVTGIAGTVEGADANAFTIENAPATLGPGESATVDIRYAPLMLETMSLTSAIFEGSDGVQATLSLQGEPVGVALVHRPDPCDFGYVPLNTTAVCCTTVTNQANVAVSITGVSGFANEGDGFGVSTSDDSTPPNPQNFPETPIDIQGGASAKVCFSLTPPITQQYSGQVTLVTTDPSGTNPNVQLTGWGGGPQISCTPPSIDFGQTLLHGTTTVPVICTNTGSAIPVTNLIIDPPIAAPSGFSAQFDQTTDVYPLNGLAPGQSAQIDVSYSPTGASSEKGTLFIKNNGGQGRTIEIPLSGQSVGTPPCQFAIVPSALDFGNVQVGGISQPLSFTVENLGADACVIQGLGIPDDTGGAFHVVSTSLQPDPSSNEFTIPASSAGGTSELTVTLTFAPPVAGSYAGEAAFAISDPGNPNQVVLLHGSSSPTCLVVEPPTLDFGDVGVSDGTLCKSAARSFSIFNACNIPAIIQAIALQSGPGDTVPQFSPPAGAAIPLTLHPGDSAEVYDLTFEPTTPGAHMAQLLISDGTVDTSLPLSGQAISSISGTDTFVVGPPKADVLFILDVDDNDDAQAAIVGEMPSFLAAAGQTDYRLAMTTSNDAPLDPAAENGRLLPCSRCSVAGQAPTIVSPSSVPVGVTGPDPAAVFTNLWNAIPSDVGYPDEQFFLTLYDTLQQDPGSSVDFFRPGAFFAAITVGRGDQDDTSRLGLDGHRGRDPGWYARFFEAHFQDPSRFSWDYVGQSPTITGTGLSAAIELPPGLQQMLGATGGFALNTHDPRWTAALESLWGLATVAGMQYPLSGQPSGGQAGISVSVNGGAVPQLAGPGDPNWTYEPALNAIAFNPSGYRPVAGDAITVTYPLACQ